VSAARRKSLRGNAPEFCAPRKFFLRYKTPGILYAPSITKCCAGRMKLRNGGAKVGILLIDFCTAFTSVLMHFCTTSVALDRTLMQSVPARWHFLATAQHLRKLASDPSVLAESRQPIASLNLSKNDYHTPRV
jgi:hypothetical protein